MTDDRSPFERQLTDRLEHMAGPEPQVDVDASVRAATTPSPRWRFPRMFSAAKLLVAGALVAAFGGYLVLDAVDRGSDVCAPGAEAAGASCSEAAALLEARESGSTADPAIVTRVSMEPIAEDGADEDSTTVDESDGYGRVGYDIDGLMVEADDDRLDGIFSGEVTVHFFTETDGYLTGVVSIDNESGSWSGQVRGFQAESGPSLHYELVGDGAYAGCAVLLHGDWDGPTDGIVFPAPAITDA